MNTNETTEKIRKLEKEKWKLINEYQEKTKKIHNEEYREKIQNLNRQINRLRKRNKQWH